MQKPSDQEQLQVQIKEALEQATGNSAVQTISVKTNLFQSGFLDSLSMVQFLMALEAKLNMVFDYKDFQMDNFETIEAIQKLIELNNSKKPK